MLIFDELESTFRALGASGARNADERNQTQLPISFRRRFGRPILKLKSSATAQLFETVQYIFN